MRTLRTLAFLAVAACAPEWANPLLAQPEKPPPGQVQPPSSPRDDAQTRAAMRERLDRMLKESQENEQKLADAIKKLDGGAQIDELRDLLPERFRPRFRPPGDSPSPGALDGPPGDAGPTPAMRRSDRPGGGRSDQPFSDQDWQAVTEIIQHAQPEMLDQFEQLRQKDPAFAQRRMLQAYPRLRPLLDLYKFDQEGFKLRLDELVIARKGLPLAKKVLDLRRQGIAEDSPEMKAALAELHDLAKSGFENRTAIERHDLQRMRERMERREKDLNERIADPEHGIERTTDALLRQAEHGGAPDHPDRHGGADGPRRRPND